MRFYRWHQWCRRFGYYFRVSHAHQPIRQTSQSTIDRVARRAAVEHSTNSISVLSQSELYCRCLRVQFLRSVTMLMLNKSSVFSRPTFIFDVFFLLLIYSLTHIVHLFIQWTWILNFILERNFMYACRTPTPVKHHAPTTCVNCMRAVCKRFGQMPKSDMDFRTSSWSMRCVFDQSSMRIRWSIQTDRIERMVKLHFLAPINSYDTMQHFLEQIKFAYHTNYLQKDRLKSVHIK